MKASPVTCSFEPLIVEPLTSAPPKSKPSSVAANVCIILSSAGLTKFNELVETNISFQGLAAVPKS